jgi:hypothetical protein
MEALVIWLSFLKGFLLGAFVTVVLYAVATLNALCLCLKAGLL